MFLCVECPHSETKCLWNLLVKWNENLKPESWPLETYCRVREIGGQRAKPKDTLRYCSCGIVAGKKSIELFVAGTNWKCCETTLCVLSWDRCLSSEATRFAVYDCTPTTCQKPCFAAGELREGCGNKGFEGLPCFPNSKIGCWPRVGMQAPFPCIL